MEGLRVRAFYAKLGLEHGVTWNVVAAVFMIAGSVLTLGAGAAFGLSSGHHFAQSAFYDAF
jgi:hypothetical protein